MLARPGQLPVRAQEQRVGPRAAPQVWHDGTIRPRASPGAAVRGLRDLLSLSRPTCHSFFTGPVFFWSHSLRSVFVLRRAGGPVSFRVFAEHAPLQHASLQLLCSFFAAFLHAPVSTLLCRARFFAEHASLQSTLLSTLLCALLCRAFAKCSLCGRARRARSSAEHASLQSALLCRARSSARARFFAECSPLQTCFRAVKGEGGKSALVVVLLSVFVLGGAGGQSASGL